MFVVVTCGVYDVKNRKMGHSTYALKYNVPFSSKESQGVVSVSVLFCVSCVSLWLETKARAIAVLLATKRHEKTQRNRRTGI